MLTEKQLEQLDEAIKPIIEIVKQMWFKAADYIPTEEEIQEKIPEVAEENIPFLVWIKTTAEPNTPEERKAIYYINEILYDYYFPNTRK